LGAVVPHRPAFGCTYDYKPESNQVKKNANQNISILPKIQNRILSFKPKTCRITAMEKAEIKRINDFLNDWPELLSVCLGQFGNFTGRMGADADAA